MVIFLNKFYRRTNLMYFDKVGGGGDTKLINFNF